MEYAMPPDLEQLSEEVAAVVVGLVAAHRRGDVEAIAAELGRLLVATARYASPERQRDQALTRSLEFTHL